MTRTLPWLKGGQSSSTASSATTSSSHPYSRNGSKRLEKTPKRRRVPTLSPSDSGINTTGVSTPDRKARFRATRTPSTSPPPAPPEEEPMRPGYAADDIWIMVEDELMSTAQAYTQHLHHAEYQRLKKLAKERGVNGVSRPLNCDLTGLPRSETVKRRRTGPTNGFSAAELYNAGREEDDPWLVDPQLGSLMESPRKPARILQGLSAGRCNGRRLSPSPAHNATNRTLRGTASNTDHDKNDDDDNDDDDDDDDDDLDRVPNIKNKTTHMDAPAPQMSCGNQPVQSTDDHKASEGIFKRFSKRGEHYTSLPPVEQLDKPASTQTITPSPDISKKKKTPPPDRGLDEDMPYKGRAMASDILAKRRARAAERERREQATTENDEKAKRKTNDSHELPTFLF